MFACNVCGCVYVFVDLFSPIKCFSLTSSYDACLCVIVNPRKSPYKLHDNLLWTFWNLTECIFHLVLTANSVGFFFHCYFCSFYLRIAMSYSIGPQIYCAVWSFSVCCSQYFLSYILTVWLPYVSHYIVYLFSISGFRHFFCVCAVCNVLHRLIGAPIHTISLLKITMRSRCCTTYFQLKSSYAKRKKILIYFNWILETHENIINLFKLIANVS